jgi:hypothetical protein
MRREYTSKGIAELRKMAQEHSGNPAILKKIVHELGFRSTQASRKLLAELTAGSSPAKPVRVAKKQTTTRATPAKRRAPEPGPVVESPAATTAPALERGQQETFELLRETFTLEAEILARWGMTPAVPKEIEKLVFAEWRKLLKGGPDDRGRSIETLEKDISKLAGRDGSEF